MRGSPGKSSFARRAALLLLALTAAAAVVLLPPALLRAAQDAVILATTTSTYDTGLLEVLVPPFEKQSGLRVKVISVGSGQALALGKRGEADLVLAHAPAAEERFMAEGAGILRLRVMYNDFVVVGPPADPAAARASRSVAEALRSVKLKGAPFVSRGDDSGTHQLERKLWERAGGAPSLGTGYLEAGQGMGATLRVASEKRAYTLSDRGTYLALRSSLDLAVLSEGDPALKNIYHLIVVNPRSNPAVNEKGARALARYLLSPEALAIVRDFGKGKFGQALFTPDAEPYPD